MNHRIPNPLESRDFQLQSRRSSGRVSPQGESGGRTYTHRTPLDSNVVRAKLISAGVLRPYQGAEYFRFTEAPPSTGPVLKAEIRWAHEVRFADQHFEDQAHVTGERRGA